MRGVILASSVPKGPPFKLLLLFFTHTLSIYYTLSGVFVQYLAKWTKNDHAYHSPWVSLFRPS